MKTWQVIFVLALIACSNALDCFAQRPGPPTLEGLLNADEAQRPDAAETESPATPKRPVGTVARPKDGVQHPDLDKAWADYDAAVTKAAEGIRAAISKQFDAATAKGDLDGAEKWQNALEKFEKAGEVPAETETKVAVSSAASEYKKARDELSKAYETVVKALTMDKKIAEAKAVRGELAGFSSKKSQAAESNGKMFLSDLNEKDTVVGWGVFGKDGNLGFDAFGERQILVNDQRYRKGLSTHAACGGDVRGKETGVSYDVPVKAKRLVGSFAIADTSRRGGSGGSGAPVLAGIRGDDGKVLWKSKRAMQKAGDAVEFSCDVSGQKTIRLVVVAQGDAGWGHAVWLDPYFELE